MSQKNTFYCATSFQLQVILPDVLFQVIEKIKFMLAIVTLICFLAVHDGHISVILST